MQKKDENKDSSTTPGETTNTKYLVVKEWGVRFPYVNEDTFSYTMQGQSNVISIVSKKLADEQGGLCKTQGGGSIERAQAADPFRKGSSGPAAAFPSYQVAHGDSVNGIGKVDNYYFGYIPNNGPNCEGDESVGKEVQQIVSRVEQAR